jgi:hypothetical protein
VLNKSKGYWMFFVCRAGKLQMAYNGIYVNLANITAGIALVIALATAALAAPSNTQTIDPKTAGLLEFIGTLEAPKGYDSYSYYAAAPPPRPLTTMTIREVLAWQDRIDARSKSEAAGRFQIMEDTLRRLVTSKGINQNLLFNEATQNRLGVILLKEAGWNPLGTNYVTMANNIAKVWAGLPLVSGPRRGESVYRNLKGPKNRAQSTPEIYLDVLKNGNKNHTVLRAVQLSKTHRRVASIESRGVKIQRISSVKTTKIANVTGGAITPSKIIVFNTDPFQLD